MGMARSYTKDQASKWRAKTKLVRGGLRRSQYDEMDEALFMSSAYVYETAAEAETAFKGKLDRFMYSRYGNPTVEMFQDRLCLLEGAEACRATASGMAAVFAALACQVKAGDRVVASRALFGSCLFILTDILPKWGVETVLVDGTDNEAWKKAFAKPTKAVFLETPSNPTLEIIDVRTVCDLAHAAGATVVVDNVFASPVLQKPLQLGADVVAYSTTKHIDGQGRGLGGAVLGTQKFIIEQLQPFYRHTGPSMSPFNAWIMLKSLETLDLRVANHCANARQIATFLSGLKGIQNVRYPGLPSHPQHNLAKAQMSDFGSIITFVVEGGKAGAFKFMDALEIVDISNNLGDTKSIVTHPATTTHQRLKPEEREATGIYDGTVRLSVGLEDVDDLKEDIARALAA
jgi:O-succinylhomoserine sulfhydrylase